MEEKHECCPHCKSTRRIYLKNKIYCRRCYTKLPKGIDEMFNKCEHLRIRSKNGKKYLYCTLQKKVLEKGDCYGCDDRKYKTQKPLKKQSTTQRRKDLKRFSLFTDDMKTCIECGKPRKDKHECIGGCNRSNSIRYGLVVPLCRECHIDKNVKRKWTLKAQDEFVELFGYDNFIKIFKMDYKEKYERIRKKCS